MTDFTPPPITVNANPNKDALEAFVRQCITVAGAVAGLFGFTHLASEIGLLLAVAGPISTLIAMGWGIIKTHALASKAVAMQAQLPDSVATTK